MTTETHTDQGCFLDSDATVDEIVAMLNEVLRHISSSLGWREERDAIVAAFAPLGVVVERKGYGFDDLGTKYHFSIGAETLRADVTWAGGERGGLYVIYSQWVRGTPAAKLAALKRNAQASR